MTRPEAEILLNKTFKLPAFYDEQWHTIDKILNGNRVLLIERTGFGKSLCYQFPANVFAGTTIIFSPLIALMRDQVKKLNGLGIAARCINSEQTPEENKQIIEDAKNGKIKILYIAPERQENSDWIEATRLINIAMIVVDEAHCISVWGHDFRPSFRRIINLVKLLPKGLPILATTATATLKVQEDITRQMGNDITTIRGNLMRSNLKLFVIKVDSEDEKMVWLGKNLDKMPGTGILYTGTRVDTEIYSRWFNYLKIPAIGYNAGLDSLSRISIENGLMNNEWKCIISTNALGMGIDKPDIRFIIHTQIPQSPIHYYQEIGRAGRDGEPAYIILFYNPKDVKLPLSFIEGSRPSANKYEATINAIKEELLGERELIKKVNLKQNQVRVILTDLLEHGIIREILLDKSKKYEYIPGSSPLNAGSFEALRNAKLKELDQMVGYVETTGSRMNYLCDYLGDDSGLEFANCDNTSEKKVKVIVSDEWLENLGNFRQDYFPDLELDTIAANVATGFAASYYSTTNIGAAIHRSKYEQGGDFPDFLLNLTLKAIRKKTNNEPFDGIVYMPPTVSGSLVETFATKIAQRLNIPVMHSIQKTRTTKEQRLFNNGYLKTDNAKGAYKINAPVELTNKNILLIDDIFDSGATMKEVCKLLARTGVLKVTPVVIAKTTGGILL